MVTQINIHFFDRIQKIWSWNTHFISDNCTHFLTFSMSHNP
jgi:hypothetical protein